MFILLRQIYMRMFYNNSVTMPNCMDVSYSIILYFEDIYYVTFNWFEVHIEGPP